MLINTIDEERDLWWVCISTWVSIFSIQGNTRQHKAICCKSTQWNTCRWMPDRRERERERKVRERARKVMKECEMWWKRETRWEEGCGLRETVFCNYASGIHPRKHRPQSATLKRLSTSEFKIKDSIRLFYEFQQVFFNYAIRYFTSPIVIHSVLIPCLYTTRRGLS